MILSYTCSDPLDHNHNANRKFRHLLSYILLGYIFRQHFAVAVFTDKCHVPIFPSSIGDIRAITAPVILTRNFSIVNYGIFIILLDIVLVLLAISDGFRAVEVVNTGKRGNDVDRIRDIKLFEGSGVMGTGADIIVGDGGLSRGGLVSMSGGRYERRLGAECNIAPTLKLREGTGRVPSPSPPSCPWGPGPMFELKPSPDLFGSCAADAAWRDDGVFGLYFLKNRGEPLAKPLSASDSIARWTS